MLPHRNSTSSNPSYTSFHQTGGRRPLSLITDQKAFRATTAEPIETESPQSDIFLRDGPVVPPMPPRPPPFPQAPPRNGGPSRQSTTPDTHESFSPTPDFPRPPKIIPRPSLPHPRISVHAASPTRPRLHFSGGFAIPSSHRRGDSHYTADYPHRFDVMPRREDSGPPHYEPEDISGGIYAKAWPTYNKISKEFDEKNLSKWNTDLDVLLIFAALFSAIVTSFLITSLSNLSPNYQQQSALLLYQILNGRDPNLASISNPTIPFRPSGFAITVNCLWFASLSASLGASFAAMICKEWLAEYNSGANPVVDLFRACQRQIRFTTLQRWNVHNLIAILPPLLHFSVLLFFTGAIIYLWQIDARVAIVYLFIGGTFATTYLASTLLPFFTNSPFRPSSTQLVHKLSIAIGKVVMAIVDPIKYACFHVLRYIIGAILWPFAHTIFSKGTLHIWYTQAQTMFSGEYKHLQIWREKVSSDFMDEIDTSQEIQEEAIMWLSQMPLDLKEFKAVVPSLALISSSSPRRFQKSVVVFLNLTLESLLRGTPIKAQYDLAIDCLLVLGHIKYQSVVDRDWDQDNDVGGIPVAVFVAWGAQQLTADAFDERLNSPYSEEVRTRLLAAAAWLSPVEATEQETPDGEKLKIQDREEFLKQLRITFTQRAGSKNPTVYKKGLVNLIHGMHACIPRGNYGSVSSIVPFLPIVCDDYDSPWSEDESVLRALITYALDLLLPSTARKPLVDREIEFDELASELIDALVLDTTSADVVAFGFWLAYRVPYAFRSRKSMLADIVRIWALTNEAVPQDHRQRMNFHAVDAFVAVSQYHASANRKLPKFTVDITLNLLKAALGDGYTRPMATYAVAMILDLGTPAQVTSFTREVDAGSFMNTLYTGRSDIEKNTAEEDTVDLYIYSTLALLKLRQPQVDVEKVKTLIKEMEKVIGDSIARDPGLARNSKDEHSVDIDRVKWKAIFLCGLLSRLSPPGEWEEPLERVRERVRMLLRSGELLVAGDYEHCLQPLDIGVPELGTPAWREGPTPMYTVFETWIKGFPLFPLAGSAVSAVT